MKNQKFPYSLNRYLGCVALLLAPLSGTATTFYIAPNGVDQSDRGTTHENPCRTPNYVMQNLMSDGDELVVLDGVYDGEAFSIRIQDRPVQGISSSQPLRIRAANPGQAEFRNMNRGIMVDNKSFITISGLHFSEVNQHWISMNRFTNHLVVEDCLFDDDTIDYVYSAIINSSPVGDQRTQHITFRNNTFFKWGLILPARATQGATKGI